MQLDFWVRKVHMEMPCAGSVKCDNQPNLVYHSGETVLHISVPLFTRNTLKSCMYDVTWTMIHSNNSFIIRCMINSWIFFFSFLRYIIAFHIIYKIFFGNDLHCSCLLFEQLNFTVYLYLYLEVCQTKNFNSWFKLHRTFIKLSNYPTQNMGKLSVICFS